MKRTIIITIALIFTISLNSTAQNEKNFRIGCIGFYNLENLFDTLDTEDVRDTEFTPLGDKKWNSAKYYEKLDNMANVISQIGTDLTPDGVAILGISEIENRTVVEDLVKQEKLKGRKYEIVHYDSPDKRGVDVGLIFQPKYFKLKNSASYTLKIEGMDDFYTRDQLLVSGEFDGEMIHVIVNHWPSRRGGEKRSRPLRNAAADLTKSICDSILNLDKNAKIIIMGDLNDDPNNESVKLHLKTVSEKEEVKEGVFYNTMEGLFKKGVGSLAYRDAWNLFDQIIISPGLVKDENNGYIFHKSFVFNKKFLMQAEGQYKGYPLRTYVGSTYKGGYSDHFPTYIFIVKEIK
ncbi:MAG: endonuclease/exonuclease/phosphatase family protein [Bacteroidales bacterium]|nr:endonuclease/exonuclease/phosphatase family protein [Bacteroidales bacterium]